MKYLLTVKGRWDLLTRARQSPLLGFDFDGTLAPIVDDPEQAAMRAHTEELFHQVARRFSCVVLSGRGREDVWARLKGAPVCEVFGNHGLEPFHISEGLLQRVHSWRDVLVQRLSGWRDVWVEDKGYSLSVHYRDPEAHLALQGELASVLTDPAQARIVTGKRVFNLMPCGDVHKGSAFIEALGRSGCENAIYVGDDKTDEDVFETNDPARVMGVHVGVNSRSAAAYHLRTQDEIDELLELLLHA